MNLIIVGVNCEDFAKKVWSANTEYAILKATNIWDRNYKSYIKGKKTITIADPDQFKSREVNEVLDMFLKNEQIPIFIGADKQSFERRMYGCLENDIPEALLIVGQPTEKEMDEALAIAQGYLYGKGMIAKNDNTKRTPKRRTGRPTKK